MTIDEGDEIIYLIFNFFFSKPSGSCIFNIFYVIYFMTLNYYVWKILGDCKK